MFSRLCCYEHNSWTSTQIRRGGELLIDYIQIMRTVHALTMCGVAVSGNVCVVGERRDSGVAKNVNLGPRFSSSSLRFPSFPFLSVSFPFLHLLSFLSALGSRTSKFQLGGLGDLRIWCQHFQLISRVPDICFNKELRLWACPPPLSKPFAAMMCSNVCLTLRSD